jgi:hypothetical protein
MANIVNGASKCVWGVQDPKPIVGAPPGRQRLRLRNKDVARLFAKTQDGIRHFILVQDGENWAIDPRLEQGRNIRATKQ